MSQAFPKLLNDERLAESREAFYTACHFSRAHMVALNAALATYGDHGPLISGCGRDHFPDAVKNDLRQKAQIVTKYSDMAYANRPHRVRKATIVALGRAVARYYGSGFYGPQG